MKYNNGDDNDNVIKKHYLTKLLWYLPIISRFKRPFTNVNDTKSIRWHADEKKWWKHLTCNWLFAMEENWFIVFIFWPWGKKPYTNYKLSPWLCVKRKYMLLSMMISRQKTTWKWHRCLSKYISWRFKNFMGWRHWNWWCIFWCKF